MLQVKHYCRQSSHCEENFRALDTRSKPLKRSQCTVRSSRILVKVFRHSRPRNVNPFISSDMMLRSTGCARSSRRDCSEPTGRRLPHSDHVQAMVDHLTYYFTSIYRLESAVYDELNCVFFGQLIEASPKVDEIRNPVQMLQSSCNSVDEMIEPCSKLI